MAVLSDADIRRRIGRGGLSIEPFDEANLTPNGYDLSLAEIQVAGGALQKSGSASIPPGAWFAVSTREHVKFPADLCGELWLRSTHIRRGVITAFGRVDAGFEGSLTLTGFNASAARVSLEVGDRYCQLVFVELSSRAEKPYAARSGNYQGQSGITLEAFAKKGPKERKPRNSKKGRS